MYHSEFNLLFDIMYNSEFNLLFDIMYHSQFNLPFTITINNTHMHKPCIMYNHYYVYNLLEPYLFSLPHDLDTLLVYMLVG